MFDSYKQRGRKNLSNIYTINTQWRRKRSIAKRRKEAFRLNIWEALFQDFARACMRRGINPNPGTIYPFQEWLKTVVVEQDVVRREHRLLSQSYYILSWLSLRNDTGFWLPVSTLGSYCMACYKRASVQRSPYSLPSLLMHFGFITPRHPSGLDSSIKIQESSTI